MAEKETYIKLLDERFLNYLKTADERRMTVNLINYWNEIRKDRLFPSEKLINPEDIPDIWEHCYLIQVNDLHNRQKADFTYLGSSIIKSYHDSFSEQNDVADIISPKSSRLAQNFKLVIDNKKPIMQSGEFVNNLGHRIRFRQCLLPLGDTDNKVEAVFGCVGFKVCD